MTFRSKVPMNYSKVSRLSIALTLAVVAFISLANSNGKVVEQKLYNQLIDIMDERKRLWFEPKPEGSRARNVTDIVCPLVSQESLMSMANAPSLSDAVKYQYFEVSHVYPDNSMRWMIDKKIGFFEYSHLIIVIGLDGHCTAQYQHG